MKKLTILIIATLFITLYTSCFSSTKKVQKEATTVVEVDDKTAMKNVLSKLTEAKELGDQPLVLDGETIPIFAPNASRVKGMDVMTYLTSEKYKIRYFKNKEGDLKALAFRDATAEEIASTLEKRALKQQQKKEKEQPLIPFEVTDLLGNKYNLETLKGKVVAINFWFIACAPCRKEIPELNELVHKYKDQEVVFLGFAEDDAASLNAFLKKKEFIYQQIPDSKKYAAESKVKSFPTHLIIDQNGKVVFNVSGYSATTVKSLDREIGALLK